MGHNHPSVNWELTPEDVKFLKALRIVADPPSPTLDDYRQLQKTQAQAEADKKQARWENYMAKYRRSAEWWAKHEGKGEDGSHYSA
jgi:hypothetical protein